MDKPTCKTCPYFDTPESLCRKRSPLIVFLLSDNKTEHRSVEANRSHMIPTDAIAYFGGHWLAPTETKEEFYMNKEEIEFLNNKPLIFEHDTSIEAIASYSKSEGIVNSGNYSYSTFATVESNKEFLQKYQNWKARASEIVSKYKGLHPKFFIGSGGHLGSTLENVASYYTDGVNHYMKGILTDYVSYDREISKDNSLRLDTWHKLIPFLTPKSYEII